ncbi:hypothetical protein GJ700_17720 [Duganella sp. FT92W]|uniref:Uncharacterized protein n=1 Tax=Pseudoduganella rivuli TaxID=2666085 RepID=A0A7X2IPD4_9BURK|nr:hypothetical protein [Pseudoduganella rivuli]MRV73554.1 hypothetical protein [Pseudoduganella rivuli]
MIKLKYPDMAFDEQELIDFISATGKSYVVQGQRIKTLAKHTNPNSLDVWLRKRFPKMQDTKLADNYVIDALVETGKLAATKEICPDSGRMCKAIRLV